MRKTMQQAQAVIGGKGVFGLATFQETDSGVLVTINAQGLPENDSGFFALHIHEGTSCSGTAFSDTGSHFNPKGQTHPMHAGDLPPLLRSGDRAYLSVLTSRFRISEIIGRTLVIHARADDFKTQPAGNAGEKIACGVIQRG